MTRYVFRDVPVGIAATGVRRERDAIGSIDVLADRYWGANTQRALKALPACHNRIPQPFYDSYGYLKRAGAMMNAQAGRLPIWKSTAIVRAADDLIRGLLADQFPLPIWQAGSGSDADTNVNEVLANRAAQLLGGVIGSREPIDPVRDVNMGLGLSGSFTASMQIATIMEIERVLLPAGLGLARALERRTSEASPDARRLRIALRQLDEAEESLHEIIVEWRDGSTSPDITEEDRRFLVGMIAADTGRPFIVAPTTGLGGGSMDAMVGAMGAVRTLAVLLLDIADSVRSANGAEKAYAIDAAANAMTMVCTHVIGQDQVVAAAACRGSAASRVMLPLVIGSVLTAVGDLGKACEALQLSIARRR